MLALAAAAAAQPLYKCRGEGAAPVYQDAPCSPGRELANLADAPSTVSVIPFEGSPRAAPSPTRPARAPPKEKPVRTKAKLGGDAAERRHVHEGMSEGEVLARIGAPDMQSSRGARRTRWTYLPAAGDPQTVTLVLFEDGKVRDVERRTLR